MAAPQGAGRERLAAGVVSVLILGIQDVFVLSFVGAVEERLVFAVLALLFLASELLVPVAVLLEGGVDGFSLRFEALQLGELGLHGFALQIRLVLGPGRVRG